MGYYRYYKLRKYVDGVATDEYSQGERADNVTYDDYSTCMNAQSSQYRWIDTQQTVCSGANLCVQQKQQVTYDGTVWTDTGNYRAGAVITYNSPNCVNVDWRVVPNEYICDGFNKCQKEAEYRSNDGGETWTPTGNTRTGSVLETNSTYCGVIYQWATLPNQYICLSPDTCSDKYTKQSYQYSTDGGTTWTDTGNYRPGSLIEADSSDCLCGDGIAQWVTVSGEYECIGVDKYTKEKEQKSMDNGVTWTDTGNTRAGSLIATDSTDCGYVPPITYLTFTATEQGRFNFSGEGINYSTDNGTTWTSLASNTYTPTISAGSKIMWKGTITPGEYGIGTFSATGYFTAEGTPMSLLYGDNFRGQTDLTGKDRAFNYLFGYNSKITDASSIVLPATTLSERCYFQMFHYCTALTAAPALPATTLARECYGYMFLGCSNLISAPALPATTLARECYIKMFAFCSNLISAPVLPATTMIDECYSYMFQSCTSLTTAPVLPATTIVDGCYNNMFQDCSNLNYIKAMFIDKPAGYQLTYNWVSGVAATGTFVKNSAATWNETGPSGIPSGWTVQTE